MRIDASRYDTDKAEHQQYLKNYEEFFEPRELLKEPGAVATGCDVG